jgi:hypothetical protein
MHDDRTFDLFLNQKLLGGSVKEEWLSEEVCVRFGFCGEEYEAILRDVKQNGKRTIVF